MSDRPRIVVDTNALISRLLLPASVAGRAVRRAIEEGQLLVSEAGMLELAEVLSRRKFDRYVSREERKQFLHLLGGIVELVPIVMTVRACRDPKDDKFLEVAVNGEANLVITGDRGLLALHPFRGITIMSPGHYLESACL
jgi:putative PIN family toxin of toxin-antitoxin system